jgi:hypothetical protein
VSQIESYSILEKISEWKKEEGLCPPNTNLPVSHIPRPLKLLQEITLDALNTEHKESLTNKETELAYFIKQEQDHLVKKQQDTRTTGGVRES